MPYSTDKSSIAVNLQIETLISIWPHLLQSISTFFITLSPSWKPRRKPTAGYSMPA